MTTVVYRDGVFAWDSQATYQNRGVNGITKVIQNGPVVFGACGTARSLNIIKHMPIPAMREYEPDFDTERWIINTLVPAIRVALVEVNAAEIQHHIVHTGGSFIVSVNGVVGYIDSSLAFFQDDTGLYGIGSGAAYALGAMKAGATPKEAVETAKYFDLYTGGEINTLDLTPKEPKKKSKKSLDKK